ncbi:hypothetical protein TBLA_0C05750 [Henningerozyma blattae CBS 6284]|uniref:116 kDa U5 small nuclear ribonucleoprotein component n=1 Tax=Henningerozyma blattae (strain ATCC 34711 / CBS 6284 / DSM 70876 / NBRC 10599 / NRRL Y-10934 / UCD 77-7) TaxID=1071380 RepID=I2H1X1_HENB6|nr:hypothetical protein TBLA_0C05750 [Tetrapisispora blattae CBS 6284]CCH60373.1 hypothetical protein TBLA_0C05750 [Tetrapisispora blattae CBS 6284]
MDEDLYDEFGNLIGQDAFDSDSASDLEETERHFNQSQESSDKEFDDDGNYLDNEIENSKALVSGALGTVYDSDVEVLSESEDRQSKDQPIVEPINDVNAHLKHLVYTRSNNDIPKMRYDPEYFLGTLHAPERVRNISVVGPLHSGKTSLVDLLVLDAFKKIPNMSKNVKLGWKPLKYTDNTKLEIDRGISTKLNGISFLATDLNDKSFALNILDTPGHVDFIDEMAVGISACDLAIICIDAVEGFTSIVAKLFDECKNRRKMGVLFVINKIDRLILEMRLPPNEAYLKMKQIVDEINEMSTDIEYCPTKNNVLFASTKLGFTFSIKEFVQYYYSSKLPAEKSQGFCQRLWGDIYFEKGKFSSRRNNSKTPTFVEFILIPLYKIFTNTLANERSTLASLMKSNFNIHLGESDLTLDPQPLLRNILRQIFRSQQGLVDSLVNFDNNLIIDNKLNLSITHKINKTETALLAHALKNIDYGGEEWSLVRIYRGSITKGMKIRVTDSSMVPTNHNDFATNNNLQKQEFDTESILDESTESVVTDIVLLGGRFTTPVSEAFENQIVLIKGIYSSFIKSATITSVQEIRIPLFFPINYISDSVFKVVIEPYNPKELPKLLDGLNKVSKYYPGIKIKIEESGEHIIVGNGELYLDCVLYDLRNNYANMEIKISMPLTIFSESCSSESFASIPVKSSNNMIEISIGVEPLPLNLIKDLSENNISDEELNSNKRQMSKLLRTKYDWDSLEARNVWTFNNCNAFIDDTLEDETDKDKINTYKKQIIQGFHWAIREGPLAEEPIYGVKFKLLKLMIDDESQDTALISTQIIPLIRKACYVGLLTGKPTVLEPIYEVQVITKSNLIPIVEEVIRKRRGGRIYRNNNIGGSPLSEIKAQIPVIDSIGFEVDLRLATRGGAMCQLHFWNKIWREVPGNVMDKDAPIPKLKPAPYNSLARDFVMKTRRRKGLTNGGFMSNDGPTLESYIASDLYEQLVEGELV